MLSLLSVFRSLSVRYLWRHPVRSLLIASSIAIGVATLVSTQILLRGLEAATARSSVPVAGADLIVSQGETDLDPRLAEAVAKVPGVKAARPFTYERVRVSEPDGRGQRTAVLIGLPLKFGKGETETTGLTVEMLPAGMAAAALTGSTPAAVGSGIVDRRGRYGANSADPLTLTVASGERKVIPIAVIRSADGRESRGLAGVTRNVIAMNLADAMRVLGQKYVDRIDVFLEDDADPSAVAAAIKEVIPEKMGVRDPDDQSSSNDELIGGLRAGFLICSAGAMVVGLFLVYNALSVSVAERRHDIGVMRSLGATRVQVAALFALEAVFLGFVGAALGVPLGQGMARLAINQIETELQAIFVQGESPPLMLTLDLVGIAVSAGVVVALLAALLPALQAAGDQPADAVRRSPGNGRGLSKFFHRAACLTMIGAGAAMILARDSLPPRWGAYGGMVSVLTGLLLAMPIAVGWAGVFIRPLVRRLFGIETRLGADNLIRAPGRTGVVIGAFGAGVALIVQIAGVGLSNEDPILRWMRRVITADLVVFGDNLAAATSSTAEMSPEFGKRIQAEFDEDIEAVLGIRYHRPNFKNTRVFMIALESQKFLELTAERNDVELPDLRKLHLLDEPNAVVVSNNFAVKHGVEPGDTISLPGPDGPIELKVRARVIDYSWNQGSVIIDRAEYARLFGDNQVDLFHVFLKNSSDSDVRQRIEAFVADNGRVAASRDVVWDYLYGLIQRLYQLAYLQEIVVGVVASLGIITALLISVLQRQRELGLLRAVGGTRTQIMWTVLSEAILMGLIGTVLGILIGLPLEYYVLKVVLYEESGFVFDMLIPWRAGLGIALGAMAVSCIAGLLPALHAMRLRITEAIAYE